jgi:hypothetical protein
LNRWGLRSLQRRLERLYALERAPDVVDFVRIGADGERETLLVREQSEEVELLLILPPHGRPWPEHESTTPNDVYLQLVEGVSHFLYLAERVRTGLPATQLELELQAEVDKFVLLAVQSRSWEYERARRLHGQLYSNVQYLHPPETEAGARYRLANDLAARFVARLMDEPALPNVVRRLRGFYRSGQTDKIRLAAA